MVFDPTQVEPYLDATGLDEIAEDELTDVEAWVEENPDYAAKYIALLRSQLAE